MVWKIEDRSASVWQGAMTEEEAQQGGVWLLRDNLPPIHPGRVSCDPWLQLWTDHAFHFERGLRVRPVQRGESAELPYGGRWEYTRVTSGTVTVTRSSQKNDFEVMLGGAEIHINPTDDRTWFRTAGGALGCRVCSYEEGLQFSRLCARSYRYYPLQTARRSERLGQFLNSLMHPGFHRALLVVYEGFATVVINDQSIDLQPLDYLYFDTRWFTMLQLVTDALQADLTLFNPASAA